MGFTREQLEQRRDNITRLIDLADQVETLQQWFQQSRDLLNRLDGLTFHQLDESAAAQDYETAGKEIEQVRQDLRAFLDLGAELLDVRTAPKSVTSERGKSVPDNAIRESIMNLLKDGRMYLIEEIVDEIDEPLNHVHRVLAKLIEQGQVAKDAETNMYEQGVPIAS